MLVTAYVVIAEYGPYSSNSSCGHSIETTPIDPPYYSFGAKSTDSQSNIFQAYNNFLNFYAVERCSNAQHYPALLPSTPVFPDDGIISNPNSTLTRKIKIAIGIAIPAFLLLTTVSAFILFRRYRKRKRAETLSSPDLVSGVRFGVDDKPEIDAEERKQYELGSEEISAEMDTQPHCVEIEGNDGQNEMLVEGTSRAIALLMTHELLGEEHCKELDASNPAN